MSSAAQVPFDVAFGIEIDYKPGTPDPARIYRAMTSLIEACQAIDIKLAKTVGPQLKPPTRRSRRESPFAWTCPRRRFTSRAPPIPRAVRSPGSLPISGWWTPSNRRSEEHTSELQSLRHLVCRLLIEKKRTPSRVSRLSLTAPRPFTAWRSAAYP